MFGLQISTKKILSVNQALLLAERGELTVDLVLDNENLVRELRQSKSKLDCFYTCESIISLMSHALTFPSHDDLRGQKFPFNSASILCSSNSVLIGKIFSRARKQTGSTFVSMYPNIADSLELDEINDKSTNESSNNSVDGIDDMKEENEIQNEILAYFFSFLDDHERTDNEILSGYFAQIFSHYLSFKKLELISYLEQTNFCDIEKMTKCLTSASIMDSLVKFLVCEAEGSKLIRPKKKEILLLIFNNFDKENEIQIYNIVSTISDLLSLNNFAEDFVFGDDSIFERLINFVLENVGAQEFGHIAAIACKVNQALLRRLDKKVISNFTYDQISESYFYLLNNLSQICGATSDQAENSYECLDDKKLSLLFDLAAKVILDFSLGVPQDKKSLGLTRVVELEFIRGLFEIALNYGVDFKSNQMLIMETLMQETHFFPTMISYLRRFPLNNMYQIEVFSIFSLMSHQEFNSLPLISLALTNSEFELLVYDDLQSSKQTYASSNRKSNSPNYPVIMQISYQLQQSENEHIKNWFKGSPKFMRFAYILAEPIIERFKEGLLMKGLNLSLSSKSDIVENDEVEISNQKSTDMTNQELFTHHFSLFEASFIPNESKDVADSRYYCNYYWKPAEICQESLQELLNELM